MAAISIIEQNELKKWDAFVASHPMGTIYQTAGWQKVVQDTFGHQPLYLAKKNLSGKIEAAMPFFSVKSKLFGKRLSSLPCAQACNPLVSNRNALEDFLTYAKRYIDDKSLSYIELKTDETFIPDGEKLGNALSGYSTYTLDLTPEINDIEKSLHKNCIRRAIKKAVKNGVELVVGDSENDVKIFYKLFLKMRKDYGLLPLPYKFFLKMWEVLNEKKQIEILHARHNGEIISSLILLKFKEMTTYEYGASRADKMHLSPSPFLLWEAIKRSKAEGYKKFDFGRTADDNENLSKFKLRWNAKREALNYYYFPEMADISAARQKSFSRQVMYHTVKNSPAALCQFMGQILYKNLV